ncbi:helix-turn-helix transcriptional regulator [Anthocerotibacter panamensis]|uniref:helix-turn-helix transcriptional regulator n=1 Tax=Anthocerotibacter panamensis TaxID=2857077 RepID=UPI001C406C63|nr:transcriptional regulator [Anthocerotibacter panamensis]
MVNTSPRQFERLLQLDDLIRSGQAETVKQLAQSLEVSERTIHTNLNFLRDRLHAPIEYDRRRGYLYSDPAWRLPLVPLTQGELFALMLGSRMLTAAAGTAYAQELESAIDQLVHRLPQQAWVDLQTVVDERIYFGKGGLIDLNPEIWKQLFEACQNNRRVEMTYYTPTSDSLSTRRFDPYLLHIYRGTNPYAIGYCHRRQEIRWFRVDRIRELRLLEEEFSRDPTFNAHDHLQMIFQTEVGGTPRAVRIRFSKQAAPYIRERRWHPSQQITEHGDGSLTLFMSVPGLAEVKRWVLGYGKDAVVEGPEELVQMVREEVESMVQVYKTAK